MLQIKTDLCKLTEKISLIFHQDMPYSKMLEAAARELQSFYDSLISGALMKTDEFKYHCKYERNVCICSAVLRINITRVMMKDGSTNAILFDFMIPYAL